MERVEVLDKVIGLPNAPRRLNAENIVVPEGKDTVHPVTVLVKFVNVLLPVTDKVPTPP